MDHRRSSAQVVRTTLVALWIPLFAYCQWTAAHPRDFKQAIERSAPAVVNIQAFAESTSLPDDDVHGALRISLIDSCPEMTLTSRRTGAPFRADPAS